jgi:transposase-like protein
MRANRRLAAKAFAPASCLQSSLQRVTFSSAAADEKVRLAGSISSPSDDEETFTFYRLPREHRKHLKSTNRLQRINQGLKRRTHVIRIFPDEQSALPLIRALAVEIHEDWIEAHLNLTHRES